MASDQSDEELAELFLAGNSEAFCDLVERFEAPVYRLLASILDPQSAESAAQDAFLAIHQNLHKFEKRASLKTWIYRIATNIALKKLRTERRRPFFQTLTDVFTLSDSQQPEPIEVLELKELREAFAKALRSLPEAQQSVVLLRGVEQLSYAEISKILGIPVATAQSRMNRSRKQLKISLAAFMPEMNPGEES